jgi:HAD superfamily hydrolase (TIGR01509 family)
MPTVKAVFWDSDNTLIDTFALHWAKHKEVLAAYGIDLDDRFKPRIHHNNGAQNYAWIAHELGLKISEAEYLNQIDSYYRTHSSSLELRSGVLEILEFFKSQNIPQIVVSNGRRNSVEASHHATNIIHYFEFLICKEDYEGRKPEPAPFITALKRLNEMKATNIQANECLAIDDDPYGIESANKAGMITIFRPTDLVAKNISYAHNTAHSTDEFTALCRAFLA